MINSFLMLGQSNMAGWGFVHEVPPICNERIQMLYEISMDFALGKISYDEFESQFTEINKR